MDAPRPVLLIDDDEDNRVIGAAMLRHHGFAVLLAEDGPAGLALARREQPAVILMDVSLPGMDGWAVTRALKADPLTRHIPVLALTANVRPEDEAEAERAGCAEFLAKPIMPSAVVAAVRRHLPEPEPLAGA